jgi:hypothetical protein
LGHDALVKRYEVDGLYRKIKYLPRVSRGRRAFAAAAALKELGAETPRPLGFLSVSRHGLPARSYYITTYVGKGVDLRAWLEKHYRGLSRDTQDALWNRFHDFLVWPYDHGVYHGDTKASNILLLTPETEGDWVFAWIDLESVRFGVRPVRSRVVRNLIQLNGSLKHVVPYSDRMAFLQRLARRFPWATQPLVLKWVRLCSRWRLRKEDLGWAGP